MALTKVEAEQLQPAQTSITSVGTLTGLTSSGTLSVTNQVAIRETAPGIQSGHSSAHSLQVGRWGGSNNRWMIVPEPEGTPLYSRELSYSFDTDTWTVEGSFAATLSTAAQPSITSVGTLTSLDISGALTGTTATLTTSGNSAQLTLKSTDDDASVGPLLDLRRDSASPADNDVGGKIRFFGDNDAGESLSFGALTMTFKDVSDGTEDGQFEITSRLNGTNRSRFLTNETETVLNEDSQNLSFRVESNGKTHMLFVDGANNSVGIGTASPAGQLNVDSVSDTVFTISTTNSTADGRINFRNSAGTDAGKIWYLTNQNRMQFYTNGTEALNIDNSQNVGIGTTDTTLYSNTSGGGIMLSAVNRLDVARAGDVVATFNRSDSNGQVIQVYRSGTQVGSISAEGGDSMIVSGGNAGTSGAGLLFHGGAAKILPARNTASIDAAIDLGQGSRRFKDIFISGGINFGAASTTANSSTNNQNDSNVLDEYEEGEFTPTIDVQNGSATLNTNMDTLFYTKIGRQVTINGRIRFSTTSASGYMRLNLPFANVSNVSSTQGDYAYFSLAGHNVNVDTDIYGVFAEVSPGNNYITLLQKFDNGPWNYWNANNFSSGDYLYVSGTYFTN